jgi:hypothetical protein
MKNQLFAILLGAITAGTVSLRAQSVATPEPTPVAAPAASAAPTPPSWAWTVEPTYVSTYMFRGQRLGGQSFEPSLSGSYGNWAFGVWANDPVNNKNKVAGQSDPEIDPQGSYTFAVNNSLSVQPGFTWYTYCRAPLNEGFYRMTFEPNLAVNYSVEALTLTPKFYYDMVLHTATYEMNGTYAVQLKSLGSEFDLSAAAGTYYGSDVVNTAGVPNTPRTAAWGNYWSAGASMPFKLTNSAKLVVGWMYTQGTDAYLQARNQLKTTNTEAVGRGVASASLVFSF